MQPNALPLPTRFGLIRRAHHADLARIVEMVGELAAHHNDTPTLTIHDLERDLFGQTPWVIILVAEREGKLIGYAAMCALIQLQFGARGMDIHHMFTDAAFRGQGVGRSLVEACKIEATALACRYLMVGTHPDNHAAQAFYEKTGFARKDAHPPRFALRLDG